MSINYANRGQGLEDMIESSNQQYFFQERALVQKVPTPVKVLNINSRTGKISNGFYEKKSTVDYIGLFEGYPIAFDAKQTKVETRFDLSNVEEHQYYYLADWAKNGGISFLVVYFSSLDEFYYLPFKLLDRYWQGVLQGGRKSIPYDEFKERWKIKPKGLILVDYLSTLKEVEEIASRE
ncbi:Holliday junction resolvase RecU [Natroniella sp. ANB-PHB2]|uniref:Holliday junction resolvase RecU n=1 Tax=Natroniella sp. ANB-PHB2 TaxID=3384444 RepID=UPI0038D41ED5